MNYTSELVLGIVQGATEFLPVSSSGHLKALQLVTDSPLAESLAFDVVVHFATLLAVLFLFWRDFIGLLGVGSSTVARNPRRWWICIVVGALPAGLIGLILKDQLETLASRAPWVIAVFWCTTAAALWTLRKPRDDSSRALSTQAALWIGVFQAFALLPGISRSGITIAAALWWGTSRQDAARFSFLCAFPLIVGATALEGLELWKAGPQGTTWTGLLVGAVAAFVTGLLALWLLLAMVRRGALHWWAPYLLVAAAGYLVLLGR